MVQAPTRSAANPIKPAFAALRHLTQLDLSRRWCTSHRTLEKWRWEKRGPRYLKIGGRVLYRLEDIEEYEATHLREAV